MNPPISPSFLPKQRPAPDKQVRALAWPADAGHHDELQTATGLRPLWQRFFQSLGPQGLGDLDARAELVLRQLRDNGVSYNAHASGQAPQRPWSLDLLPMLIGADEWATLQAGVLQRTRLLNAVLADVYGAGDLVRRSLLPAALVQGHPAYLRGLQGLQVPHGQWLPMAAFDLARGPNGQWWVVAQRAQAPSGLGYLLENRITIARQFPDAFAALQVQRLAGTYQAWMRALEQLCPAGDKPRIVLLTPGPYNETYFEHAYLARYLGIPLVEGSDLTVRDQRVYLKTLQGLEPVHGIIKRLDDRWLDPLELRADSTLGVPGLLQALRAGHVWMVNPPGTGLLECSALQGFLPAIGQHLLGEDLQLPALPTWWCGEEAVLREATQRLGDSVVRSTYPGSGRDTVMGRHLSTAQRDEWTDRLLRERGQHTVQRWLPLSQTPTWRDGRLLPRSAMLRVFALSDGPDSWRVLPGGLVRLAPRGQLMASMQSGGSSADCWVQTRDAVDTTTLLPSGPPTLQQLRPGRPVSSRAGENLFWLGRYTERAENSVRLARLIVQNSEEAQEPSAALWRWWLALASDNGLVPEDPQHPLGAAWELARRVAKHLGPPAGHAAHNSSFSVGFNLRALHSAAAQVRDRLSPEHSALIEDLAMNFATQAGALAERSEVGMAPAQVCLRDAGLRLTAITGLQTDRMVRDHGWRLLSVGRHIERLTTLSQALLRALQADCLRHADGFDAVLALFDSGITFQARHQQRREPLALIDLLVIDRDNPRSLGWVLQTLRGRLDKLAQGSGLSSLSSHLPDPEQWRIEDWFGDPLNGQADTPLATELQACMMAAMALSDDIMRRHFSHADTRHQSVGA